MKNANGFLAGLLVLPLALAWLALATADSVTVPNTFVGGSVASASEVNANFAALQTAVNDNDARLDSLEAARTLVSYATGAGEDGSDDAVLSGRTLTFTKVHASSTLRIAYCDTFRIFAAVAGARWEVLLDDASVSPGPIELHLWEGSAQMQDHHRTSTLLGYAEGVAAGTHTLTVRVGPIAGIAAADAFTGWKDRRWVLEVQEIPTAP